MNDENYFGRFSEEDVAGLLEVMENILAGWASFLAPIVMKYTDVPSLTAELEESFCTADPNITKRFARVTFFSDHRKEMQQLDIPVLILQCSDDSIAPKNIGDYLHKAVNCSVLVKMEATGNCSHMSHPEETIKAIKDLLEPTSN